MSVIYFLSLKEWDGGSNILEFWPWEILWVLLDLWCTSKFLCLVKNWEGLRI